MRIFISHSREIYRCRTSKRMSTHIGKKKQLIDAGQRSAELPNQIFQDEPRNLSIENGRGQDAAEML